MKSESAGERLLFPIGDSAAPHIWQNGRHVPAGSLNLDLNAQSRAWRGARRLPVISTSSGRAPMNIINHRSKLPAALLSVGILSSGIVVTTSCAVADTGAAQSQDIKPGAIPLDQLARALQDVGNMQRVQ